MKHQTLSKILGTLSIIILTFFAVSFVTPAVKASSPPPSTIPEEEEEEEEDGTSVSGYLGDDSSSLPQPGFINGIPVGTVNAAAAQGKSVGEYLNNALDFRSGRLRMGGRISTPPNDTRHPTEPLRISSGANAVQKGKTTGMTVQLDWASTAVINVGHMVASQTGGTLVAAFQTSCPGQGETIVDLYSPQLQADRKLTAFSVGGKAGSLDIINELPGVVSEEHFHIALPGPAQEIIIIQDADDNLKDNLFGRLNLKHF
ncbi:MAG: hypothetical protein IJR58_02590 [Lachnospiraceae bacterium]|nr:hypothetical protein [Lachnospiraceae bacterium]